MSYLDDAVLDFGLATISQAAAPALHIASAEATTLAELSTVSLGMQANVDVSAPADALPSGRAVMVGPVAEASVSASGTAGFWVLADPDAGRVLAANALTNPQAVAPGNLFSLDPVSITLPDAD